MRTLHAYCPLSNYLGKLQAAVIAFIGVLKNYMKHLR